MLSRPDPLSASVRVWLRETEVARGGSLTLARIILMRIANCWVGPRNVVRNLPRGLSKPTITIKQRAPTHRLWIGLYRQFFFLSIILFLEIWPINNYYSLSKSHYSLTTPHQTFAVPTLLVPTHISSSLIFSQLIIIILLVNLIIL